VGVPWPLFRNEPCRAFSGRGEPVTPRELRIPSGASCSCMCMPTHQLNQKEF
jgi:hypothetical protein